MGVIDSILAASERKQSEHKDPATWLVDWFGGRQTAAGMRMTPEKALGLSTYFLCTRAISEDIAKLPFRVYRRRGCGTPAVDLPAEERWLLRGKDRLPDHPANKLLHEAPNADTTAMVFKETLTGHAVNWGGGFAEIERDGAGRPVAMHLIHPSRVQLDKTPGGRDRYKIRVDAVGVEYVYLLPAEVFHLHGLGGDGKRGYMLSVIAKEAIALGLSAERYGARFFQKDARPGGIIKHPQALGPDARTNIREAWIRAHAGETESHEVAIFEEGMEWQPIGVPPEEAQFLATREFNVEDVCRWFRFPPSKAMSMRGAPRANVEQQNISYAGDTLMPWAVRWEQEAKRKLFPDEDGVFAEIALQALLRGDMKARAEYYRIRFSIGSLNQNEIKELESENPIGPEGETYYVPSNLTPAALAAQGIVSSGKPGGKPQERQGTIGVSTKRLARQAHALLAEALERVTAKEIKAVQRAAKKHEGDAEAFGKWAEEFYAEHGGYMAKALTQPAMMVAAIIEEEAEVPHAQERAKKIMAEAAQQETRLAWQAAVSCQAAGQMEAWQEETMRRPEGVAGAMMMILRAELLKEIEV